MFQAIENAGQYTQPPMTTKARQAGGKGAFMLHRMTTPVSEQDDYSPQVAHLP